MWKKPTIIGRSNYLALYICHVMRQNLLGELHLLAERGVKLALIGT